MAAAVAYPSSLTEAHAQEKAGPVVLAGKLVSTRNYFARGRNAARTQLILADAPDSFIQIVILRDGGQKWERLLGRHVQAGPVTVRPRALQFDSSVSPFTAYADRNFTCREGLSPLCPERCARLDALTSFTPRFTDLGDVQPATCVNVAALVCSVSEVPAGKPGAGLRVTVDDGSPSGGRTEALLPYGWGRFDAYVLHGPALRAARPGDVVFLLDFMSDLRLEEGRVRMGLKAWGPSRLQLGTQKREVEERLRERVRDADAGDAGDRSAGVTSIEGVRRMLSSVSTVAQSPPADCMVWGTLASVESGFPYTRAPRPPQQPQQPQSVDWEGEGGGGGGGEGGGEGGGGGDPPTAVKYDVLTTFREDASVYRWTDGAVGRALMAGRTAAEFQVLTDEEKNNIVEDAMGRVAAMRVWKKSDGMLLVMDACLLGRDEDSPESCDGQGFRKRGAAAPAEEQGSLLFL